ncbi:MAG: hypothetical protein HQ498_07215 [Pseudohongiella sp.]|nr:hypothetical protein [Pseudohongiella sp.]
MRKPSLLILIILFSSTPLLAKADVADIQITILNPVGFIRPGGSENIIVEIYNPDTSGITITDASGKGYSPPQQPEGGLPTPALGNRISYGGPSDLCPRAGICLVSGQLPIKPGESAQIAYTLIQVPQSEELGRELRFDNPRLGIRTPDSRQSVEYYLHTDIVRIVSAEGRGDAAILENLEIANTGGGVLDVNASVVFDHPAELVAGESFTIEMTLTNEGFNALFFMPRFSASPFEVIDGNHKSSFQFIGCERQCYKAGALPGRLEPGETATWEMGTYYYKNELLFDGDFILDRLQIALSDHLQRRGFFIPETKPIEISIISPTNGESINAAMQIPSRSPLELRELDDTGEFVVVFDPNTGNEWLKLTAAEHFTLQEIQEETVTGGLFQGFELADSGDVETLILNYIHASGIHMVEQTMYSMLDTETDSAMLEFVDLIGEIPSVNSGARTIGIVKDQVAGTNPLSDTNVVVEIIPRGNQMLVSSLNGISKRTMSMSMPRPIYSYVGYWMVRAP